MRKTREMKRNLKYASNITDDNDESKCSTQEKKWYVEVSVSVISYNARPQPR